MSMGMQVTAEDRDEGSHPSQETTVASKMYFYGRELCFILALIFTSYAALQNAPPKVSKSPLPVRFFPPASLVADFYYGQLSVAFERVSESDISFVMYYAPWDAESQAVRTHFALVAQYYYKEVYFAAINCWQPLGECRQQFSKIQHFPILIAYTQHTKGIQYKGVKDAAHMMKFLQSIIKPLERLEQPSELVDMMASHDAVIVGLFDFKGNLGCPGYHTFYSSALKFLERDPQREVGFGVTTNEVAAARMGCFNLPTVRLYLWNETLEYGQSKLTVGELVKWIASSVHQVSVWLSPPGVKSFTLSPYVEKGAVLMLFTPRNPLLTHNLFYDQIREIGLEYYNCDNNTWISDLAWYITKKRDEVQQELGNLESHCELLAHNKQVHSKQVHSRMQQAAAAHSSRWPNSSHCSCCQPRSVTWGLMPQPEASGVPVPGLTECRPEPPAGILGGHPHSCSCWEQLKRHNYTDHMSTDTLVLPSERDELSAPSLVAAALKERCRLWHQAQAVHTPVVPSAPPSAGAPTTVRSDLRGLACRTNQTISLLAMDSLHFHQFAEGLGLDVLTHTDKSAAVIFHAELESTYTLEEPLSRATLVEFILNYTKGVLQRSLRVSPREYATSLNKYPEHSAEDCRHTHTDACILELTSRDFFLSVMNPIKDVVLFYHSPYCAFCHNIGHIYLTVARYFKTLTSLDFYRIDGENNDLPWEFTVGHYPTILFFPAHRKSESRMFPAQLPMTVQNLVRFVLANLGEGLLRLEGLVALCSSWEEEQDDISAKECLSQCRSMSVELIANTLSQYRTSIFRLRVLQTSANGKSTEHQCRLHKQTKYLLFKLQILKEIHLLLGSVARLMIGSSEYRKIRGTLEVYHTSILNSKSSEHSCHGLGAKVEDS